MNILQRDAEKDRKVKALLDLANYLWKDFDGRRAQEWKSNFALWAALAALVGISTWNDVKLSYGLAWCIWIFLAWVVLIYWMAWQTGMWRRNFEDIQDANEALERVRVIVNERKVRISERKRGPDPRWDGWDYLNVARTWSRGSQLAFTVGFAVIAGVTVWYRVTPAIPMAQQAPKCSVQETCQLPSQNPTPITTPSVTPTTPNAIPARP